MIRWDVLLIGKNRCGLWRKQNPPFLDEHVRCSGILILEFMGRVRGQVAMKVFGQCGRLWRKPMGVIIFQHWVCCMGTIESFKEAPISDKMPLTREVAGQRRLAPETKSRAQSNDRLSLSVQNYYVPSTGW